MPRAAAGAQAQPQRTAAKRRHPCNFTTSAAAAHAPSTAATAADANRHRSIRLLPPTHPSLADDLQQRLAGRYIAECGGAGNCLFHTLSFLAYDRPDQHTQLRHAVADWLVDAQHAQHPVVRKLREELALHAGIDGMPVHTLEEYAGHIRRNGVQASTRYELPVLAELLQLEIHVVMQVQMEEDSAAADQLRDHVVMPASLAPLRRSCRAEQSTRG